MLYILVEIDQRAAAPDLLGQRQTVLVVEDEVTIRQLVIEILADAGCRVFPAADGSQAVALLRSDERIDLLITDIGLPGGLDGREVAKAGRAHRPDLRVLFVTGDVDAEVTGGRLEGGAAVLTKPFKMSALEACVSEMLGI